MWIYRGHDQAPVNRWCNKSRHADRGCAGNKGNGPAIAAETKSHRRTTRLGFVLKASLTAEQVADSTPGYSVAALAGFAECASDRGIGCGIDGETQSARPVQQGVHGVRSTGSSRAMPSHTPAWESCAAVSCASTLLAIARTSVFSISSLSSSSPWISAGLTRPVLSRDQFGTINAPTLSKTVSCIDQKARQTSIIDNPTKSAKPPPPVQIRAAPPIFSEENQITCLTSAGALDALMVSNDCLTLVISSKDCRQDGKPSGISNAPCHAAVSVPDFPRPASANPGRPIGPGTARSDRHRTPLQRSSRRRTQ
jgi:hypothetical protein